MPLVSSLCFHLVISLSLGTLQFVSPPSFHSFVLLTCLVPSVLTESQVFICISFLSVFLSFFSGMQVILNKLESFYSDVLSLFFSSILIILMGVEHLASTSYIQ